MLARLLIATLLVLPTAAIARTQGPTLREKQLFACADDLRRLCHGNMSDSKKFKTCIRPNKAIVSTKCRAWVDVPE